MPFIFERDISNETLTNFTLYILNSHFSLHCNLRFYLVMKIYWFDYEAGCSRQAIDTKLSELDHRSG